MNERTSLNQFRQHCLIIGLQVIHGILSDQLGPIGIGNQGATHRDEIKFFCIHPANELDLNLAGWVKQLSGKPAISVGSVSLSEEFIATCR